LILSLTSDELLSLFRRAEENSPGLVQETERKWTTIARKEQLPPTDDDWITWLLLAGRGFGKTRTGAETVRALVDSDKVRRIALVGPTAADVRAVMVEGQSGLMSVYPPGHWPVYEPANHRILWENGAVATCYSADEPQRLRGPQHDLAWGMDWIGVCRARGQFSAWNPGDPNRAKLLAVKDSDPDFRLAKRIAADAIAGRIDDPTFGATAYRVADQPWPFSWGHFRLPLVEIGRHAFYNFAKEP
jgi:hypothetical protein